MPKPYRIRCPLCGYCPAEQVEASMFVGVVSEKPKMIVEQLDCFEVLGCSEGKVMCPLCAKEFDALPLTPKIPNRT